MGRRPHRAGQGSRQGEPGNGRRATPRTRLHRLRDRLRGRLLDGLPLGRALRRAGARRRHRALACTRRSPASSDTSSATRSTGWRSGCSTTRPASRPPAAQSSVVFHPGFLLGRTHEEAIAASSSSSGELRERLEAKGRAVPFGVEVMGRVRDLGTADDVLAIAAQLRLGAAGDRLRAPARGQDGAFTDVEPFAEVARGGRRRARAGRAVPHPLLATSQFANRNETKHLPYGEGTLRAEPLRGGARRFDRPATVISESPDEGSTQSDPRGAARGGAEPGAGASSAQARRGRRAPRRRGRASRRNSSKRGA